jgi:RND family efflux transporter MFP subunit
MTMDKHPLEDRPRRRIFTAAGVVLVLIAASGFWWWSRAKTDEGAAKKGPAAVTVVTASVESRDVPVRITANGTVVSLQSVDIRAQVTATVREVHIREGQNVKAGDLLFSLDSRAEDANLRKAEAQVEKDRADLATAMRNLDRQRELFVQKFVSQAGLDTSQNQVDTLRGQLAVDLAAIEGAKVARAYNEIRASFAGRTGTIGVRAGSLVQPAGTVLVTVTQIDPVSVSFTLPEKEFAGLQRAVAAGPVPVTALLDGGKESLTGKITFVDNAVDTVTGTIRVKADFPNPNARLWPGMYVTATLSPRTLEKASVVPAQAVQTGPDSRFLYVVSEDKKVALRPVTLQYVEAGFAVISGVEPGTRVVVEGAQNLRPGALVAEAQAMPGKADAKKSAKGDKEEKKS